MTRIKRLNPIFFMALATEPMFSGNLGLTRIMEMRIKIYLSLHTLIISRETCP